MTTLSLSRLENIILGCRAKCDELAPEKLSEIDKTLDLTFEEHFKFQQLQAEAHLTGLLDTDSAQVVYSALGEVGSSKNGGWSAGVDTATKYIVTQLMGELLARKVGQR